jgi:hypothetical protein
LYDFIVFRLVSYHTDAEVVQTGKQSLPEDGIVLPKHVGVIVRKNEEIYNFSAFGWFISTTTKVLYTKFHKNLSQDLEYKPRRLRLSRI